MTFRALPAEIVYLICGYLDAETLKVLRLIDRNLAIIVSEQLFVNVAFKVDPRGLKNLQELAYKSNLRHFVKEIIFYDNDWRVYGQSPELENELWPSNHHRYYAFFGLGQKRRSNPYYPTGPAEALQKIQKHLGDIRKDPSGLTQDHRLNSLDAIIRAIGAFPKLKIVKRLQRGKTQSEYETLTFGYRGSSGEVLPIARVSRRLHRSPPLMEIHDISSSFVFVDHIWKSIHLAPILSDLRLLSVIMSPSAIPSTQEDTVRKEMFRILKKCPNLLGLEVRLRSAEDGSWLHQLLEDGLSWQNLKLLFIDGDHVYEEDLVRFETRHRQTLILLCLRHCRVDGIYHDEITRKGLE